MKRKVGKLIFLTALIMLATAFYNLWTLRPVRILYVDSFQGMSVNIVVDHFPWADKDRITWFLSHKDELQRKYPVFNGNTFEVVFLGAEKGFMSLRENPHEDLRCFEALKKEKNCIEKDVLLVVNFYAKGITDFEIGYGGPAYQILGEGNIETKPGWKSP